MQIYLRKNTYPKKAYNLAVVPLVTMVTFPKCHMRYSAENLLFY